jgi:hypothetical protein
MEVAKKICFLVPLLFGTWSQFRRYLSRKNSHIINDYIYFVVSIYCMVVHNGLVLFYRQL